jgi:hypothetical protein
MGDTTYTEDDVQRLGGVIAEDIISQFKTGFEAIEAIRQQTAKIPKIEVDIQQLQSDMTIVKAAVTDTSRAQHALEQRVVKLEAGAA